MTARQRKTNVWYHLYVGSKEWSKWIYLQNINRYDYQRGKGKRGINWEVGIHRYTLYIK